TKHLLLFTIGPVQSFIAQARKTQDLYAGSKLLSDLIECAIKALPQGSEVIFPAKNIQSKPNRFLAVINNADLTIGKAIEKTVKDKFLEITNNSYGNKPLNFDDQIKNFLDINWVILPYEEEKYKETYKEIEKTLGAIKNVRAFNQLDELGRKCSLCGERNVLFYKECSECKKGNKEKHECTYNKVKLKPNWKNFDDNNFEDQEIKTKIHHYNNSLVDVPGTKVQSGEGLCAVCFTKRFYKPCHSELVSESFPSTAEIALMESLKHLDSSLLSQYKDLFKSYTFDEQLYFDENLTEAYFKKNGLEGLKDQLPEIKKKNEEIKKATKDKGLKLNKYYAIIALDGDKMGKWLSGELIQDISKLKDFHHKLSSKLGTYAGNVKTYIKEDDGSGKLVYSGGDDVLAFVNLNHLTDVLEELRTNFPDFGGTEESSASCGVAIAHYKIPLGEVLKRARKMEKAAKEKGNRNAFGIAVLKHSGEIEETVFKWGESQASIGLLSDLIDHLKKEEFSNTFIKSLNVELHRLMNDEGKIDNHKADDIIDTELKRLLIRSRNESKGITKDKAIELAEKIFSLFKSKSNDVQNFLSFLNIADFLTGR
ncbi:MAG: type III-B CRISPR-associated protein Cas10/Cmr2, partial [Cyanobacteriota bacterium]